MKFIFEGGAKSRPAAIGLLTEDLLLNPAVANEKLAKFGVKIEKVETVNGQKVVYITETETSNLLNG